MKILIVAAKTGGHVFPASSIAKELILNNHEIVFLELGPKLRRMHTKIYLLRHIIFQFRVIEMKM